jgi:hypothetical protein
MPFYGDNTKSNTFMYHTYYTSDNSKKYYVTEINYGGPWKVSILHEFFDIVHFNVC